MASPGIRLKNQVYRFYTDRRINYSVRQHAHISLKKIWSQQNLCVSLLNLFQQTVFLATLSNSLYHEENWGLDLVSVSAASGKTSVSLMAQPPLQSEQDLTSSLLNSEKHLWTTEHSKISPLPKGNFSKEKPSTDLWLQFTTARQLSRSFVSEKDKSNLS